MTVSASEFKAKCLEIIDKVHRTGEPVTITKRGKVVARLVAEHPDERPWMALRESPVQWKGDPFAPAVDEDDLEAAR
jgi:prevent-host-death family protein